MAVMKSQNVPTVNGLAANASRLMPKCGSVQEAAAMAVEIWQACQAEHEKRWPEPVKVDTVPIEMVAEICGKAGKRRADLAREIMAKGVSKSYAYRKIAEADNAGLLLSTAGLYFDLKQVEK